MHPCVRKVWGVETLWLVLRRANTPLYYNIDQTYSYHCWLKFAESLKSALGKIFFWHICRIICLHRALHYKCKSWIFFDWAMITGMFSTILPHIRSFSQTVLSWGLIEYCVFHNETAKSAKLPLFLVSACLISSSHR